MTHGKDKWYQRLFGKKKDRRVFVLTATAFSVLQFIVFYVVVNFNQIVLAFKTYDSNGFYSFAGISNFRLLFYNLFNDVVLRTAFVNSIIFLAASVICIFLALIFSYLLWKKPPFRGFFQLIILLPSIVSTMVFVLIFHAVAK